MSYLVIGLFPNQVEVDKVLENLKSAGYYDYSVSPSHAETESEVGKKNGFWNWFLDLEDSSPISYQDNISITLKVQNTPQAQRAKNMLQNLGATDLTIRNQAMDKNNSLLYKPADQSARILTKARNSLFFVNDRKPHWIHQHREELDGSGTVNW